MQTPYGTIATPAEEDMKRGCVLIDFPFLFISWERQVLVIELPLSLTTSHFFPDSYPNQWPFSVRISNTINPLPYNDVTNFGATQYLGPVFQAIQWHHTKSQILWPYSDMTSPPQGHTLTIWSRDFLAVRSSLSAFSLVFLASVISFLRSSRSFSQDMVISFWRSSAAVRLFFSSSSYRKPQTARATGRQPPEWPTVKRWKGKRKERKC